MLKRNENFFYLNTSSHSNNFCSFSLVFLFCIFVEIFSNCLEFFSIETLFRNTYRIELFLESLYRSICRKIVPLFVSEFCRAFDRNIVSNLSKAFCWAYVDGRYEEDKIKSVRINWRQQACVNFTNILWVVS